MDTYVPPRGRILGLDIGLVRTGIALSDELGWTASPLQTVPTETLPAVLPTLIEQHSVVTVVAGRPRNMDGSLGEQDQRTSDIVAQFSGQITVPIVYEDESATTLAAGAGATDADAARVMLQGYLDENTS